MRPPPSSTPIPLVVLLGYALVLVPSGAAGPCGIFHVPCYVQELYECLRTTQGISTTCIITLQDYRFENFVAEALGWRIREITAIGLNISDRPSNCYVNRTVIDIIVCRLLPTSEEVMSSFKGLSFLTIKQSYLQRVPRGLTALNYLRINENPIRLLQGVLVMPRLYQLHLSSNEIERIDEDYLSGLANLRVLVLYDNKIRRLPAAIFKTTKKLRNIDLRKNRIDAIGSEFHQLPYLEVSSVD
ncbi:hypothetical protein MTO96_044238 [Rhipicephalus appendiculatus]